MLHHSNQAVDDDQASFREKIVWLAASTLIRGHDSITVPVGVATDNAVEGFAVTGSKMLGGTACGLGT